MQAVKKILLFLKPYKWLAILGPLLMVVEVTMDLIQPTIMQHIIDTGIANQDHTYVVKMGILMIVSALVGLVGGVGCSIFSAKTAVHFATDIRKDLYDTITYFSSSNRDSFGTGKLITIMTSDVEALQRALMMTLKIFVRGPLLFVGSIVIVFMTARELFPVLLVVVPVLIICIYFFTKLSGAMFGKVQQAIDAVNTKLQENLAGIRVIKAFNRKRHQIEQFTDVNDQLTKRTITADQVVAVLMPLTMFVINMGIIAALWFGAIKVDNGTLQVGVILAFINYLTIIMNGLISSSMVLMQIARAFPSANRVHQILATPIDVQNAADPIKLEEVNGAVTFENVSFSYSKNGEQVLKNISFTAHSGDFIGIIGTTGSGKSTLVKMIPRLFDVDEGQIFIDDIPLKQYDLETLRENIGFTPQKATLFSGSIKENLQYGNQKSLEKDMYKALDAASAMEFVGKLKEDLQHNLTQGATNLSGGQRQRLALARALIRKPSILILDDTTSAVDSISEKNIQQAIATDYQNTTTFIVASKISSIMNADKILVMEDGAIVGMGTHEELLENNTIYQEIYDTQVEKGGVLSE
ncbi:ABC transporter ATP-binding protein [Viridibacillus arvi]|uniref:ABC transporter ATP-binding protein n=1 Tax=Viridibacillus arvi TaxID=263475 RepID=UPI0034CD59F7